MAIGTGPFPSKESLVFGYDTGEGVHFPGKPTLNRVGSIGYSYGTQTGTYFKTNYGVEKVNIPKVGYRDVTYCNIYNDYNGGSGNCCPSPFSFGGASVTGSTQYTYQIIFRTSDGYYHPNYMYHYEYGPGGYLTEYGLVDGGRMTDLGNGWKHAWGTFTSNASATSFGLYLFHYQYATWNKIQVAAISLIEGNTILKPSQIMEVGRTRSVTASIIDLARNTTFDASNVTFNTSGDMVFDGSNDYIDVPAAAFPAMNQITIELVNYGINAQNSSIIAGGIGGNQDLNIHLPWGDGNIYWDVGRPFNRIYKAAGSEYQGWHHWVFTKNSSTGVMNIYKDGALWHTGTGQTSPIISLSGGGLSLGRYHNGSFTGYHHNGTVPTIRVYSREFSAAEVAKNFSIYKTRFGI